MKTLSKILPAGILILSCLFAQASDRKKEKADPEAFNKLVELVKSNLFYVEATDAYPSGNSSITVQTKHGSTTIGGEGHISLSNNRGELIMMDSVVTGHLPFFGRAYSLPYGEGGGIEFDKTRVKERSIKVVNKRKKQYVEYTFDAQSKNDMFTFYIEVYSNGNCVIKVNSNNRAAISYSGKLTEIPKDKAAIYLK